MRINLAYEYAKVCEMSKNLLHLENDVMRFDLWRDRYNGIFASCAIIRSTTNWHKIGEFNLSECCLVSQEKCNLGI